MSRGERRYHDKRIKARVRWVMDTVWGKSGRLGPHDSVDEKRRIGKEASRHLCTGRHRWCQCTASGLRRMGYVTRQEVRADEGLRLS